MTILVVTQKLSCVLPLSRNRQYSPIPIEPPPPTNGTVYTVSVQDSPDFLFLRIFYGCIDFLFILKMDFYGFLNGRWVFKNL